MEIIVNEDSYEGWLIFIEMNMILVDNQIHMYSLLINIGSAHLKMSLH